VLLVIAVRQVHLCAVCCAPLQGSPFNRATVQEHGWSSLGPVALLIYPAWDGDTANLPGRELEFGVIF